MYRLAFYAVVRGYAFAHSAPTKQLHLKSLSASGEARG